jgi:hypothetical protein
MIEIIALLVLLGKIGDMARRRGRNPSLFGLLLLVCWLGGEVAGAVLGYMLSGSTQAGEPNLLLLIYGLTLAGAAIGAGIAFLVARSLGPVDGVWREPADLPVRRSRLWGVVVGGVGGGVIGAIVTAFMYGGEQSGGNPPLMPMIVLSFLAVGFIGALLGLVSGVQKG